MRRTTSLLLLALCAGCSTVPEGQRATRPATGPPEVRLSTVEEHARQFDEEEPLRLAGSQEELAASAYIVAHLTDAGYVSRLDAVPVEDAVRSTNVVALAPSGREPEAVVVVAYDSAGDSAPGGKAIGVWLEVARALRAVEPEHSVEFVALGAEHTDVNGGRLGSRRLVNVMETAPEVIVVVATPSKELRALGYARRELEALAREQGVSPAPSHPSFDANEVFRAAALDSTSVSGPPEEVGPVLLAYLSDL